MPLGLGRLGAFGPIFKSWTDANRQREAERAATEQSAWEKEYKKNMFELQESQLKQEKEIADATIKQRADEARMVTQQKYDAVESKLKANSTDNINKLYKDGMAIASKLYSTPNDQLAYTVQYIQNQPDITSEGLSNWVASKSASGTFDPNTPTSAFALKEKTADLWNEREERMAQGQTFQQGMATKTYERQGEQIKKEDTRYADELKRQAEQDEAEAEQARQAEERANKLADSLIESRENTAETQRRNADVAAKKEDRLAAEAKAKASKARASTSDDMKAFIEVFKKFSAEAASFPPMAEQIDAQFYEITGFHLNEALDYIKANSGGTTQTPAQTTAPPPPQRKDDWTDGIISEIVV
jgi:hypothetical protein